MLEFKAQVQSIRTYVDKGASPEPHSRIYVLKIPEGIDFPYKPGQFCQLALDDFPLRGNPGLLKWSSYSIASAPFQKGILEFSIRLLDTPGFTHHLKECCQIGKTINVRGPFGVFTMVPSPKRLMFVCTGTGIAPLISHIRALLNDGSKIPISLFFGFKNPDVYLFREELEEWAGKFPNFKLEPTITDVGRDDWGGRVSIFHDFFPTYQFEAPFETDVFICGNPKMVDDVKAILPQVGFLPEMIHVEPW